MKLTEIQEIIDCLPKDKTPFLYFKDRYALMLLAMAIERPVRKSSIRRSPFAKLLDKSVVKQALSRNQQAPITAQTLEAWWPPTYQSYVLTLGRWGSMDRHWDQTSRPGYNLVLQLNFSKEHERAFRRAYDESMDYVLEFEGHPIAKSDRKTLGWARIDLELGSGEALIEELQSDWIKFAKSEYEISDDDKPGRAFKKYFDEALRPHLDTWDEALLAATIEFLRSELGITRIYYHTHGSGAALKRIAYTAPPRSVYTTLPRKFCFRETSERPSFLQARPKSAAARERWSKAKFQELPVGPIGE